VFYETVPTGTQPFIAILPAGKAFYFAARSGYAETCSLLLDWGIASHERAVLKGLCAAAQQGQSLVVSPVLNRCPGEQHY
jgi:hypothetical protein